MPSLTLTDLQVQLLGAVAANMELTITATVRYFPAVTRTGAVLSQRADLCHI